MFVSRKLGQHAVGVEVDEATSSSGPWPATVVMSDGVRYRTFVADGGLLDDYLTYAQLGPGAVVFRGRSRKQLGSSVPRSMAAVS
jgi:hypothetical protein